MNISWNQIQEDTLDAVGKSDTLTQSYSSKWEAASGFEDASPLIQAVASNDLIFVVLGVSLIIWFILLYFIVRVDRKVSRLEQQISPEQTNEEDSHEA